jgi:hypothetical protein
MTMPPGEDGSYALLGQILAKQAEMSVQLAVIQKTLDAIPDHEARLRALERWRPVLPASLVTAIGSGVVSALSYLNHH